ncbi:YpdA family putative bacillithiol disulfide reductase [Pallidibacillus pasinlerensis]|uniref:YpdA family putative bacillithiol disulfide reductase n=1 Tax=Pallidibacillus pasinlerensis TaxID=2703818 RepID=A0ABX0A582_9BACI|nr:YpdA family putative bacillithiol disulfide reductase [Pallidibacillus pasinlerensis]NCU16357.1 YpdA family putative bacillithiol disulfide reductase [Pallidibacillus pasinlerensis]
MQYEDCIIVGGGPCGLAAAISLQNVGINPLVIEKGNIVEALYRFPTHQTFFSSSERLEIGNVPFITENLKPTRNQALAYYRGVAELKDIRVNTYEKVLEINKIDECKFIIKTSKDQYEAKYVIIATGYYDNPNYMNVPGEDLPKVFHYFKEAHPFFNTDVVVIGGKNSSVDAAIELNKAGARVTVLYRGSEYSNHIKPWVLPEFLSLVRNKKVEMVFNAHVKEITEHSVIYEVDGETKEIKNDFVFAMTGYHPDHGFLKQIGVGINDETGRPTFNDETMETNVSGVFIAGVIAAGNNANEIFIENGRFHGDLIANEIKKRMER